jgi:hypothetical protein
VFERFRRLIKASLVTEPPFTGECPRPEYHRYYIKGDEDPLIGGHDIDSYHETDADDDGEIDDFEQENEHSGESTARDRADGAAGGVGPVGKGAGQEEKDSGRAVQKDALE